MPADDLRSCSRILQGCCMTCAICREQATIVPLQLDLASSEWQLQHGLPLRSLSEMAVGPHLPLAGYTSCIDTSLLESCRCLPCPLFPRSWEEKCLHAYGPFSVSTQEVAGYHLGSMLLSSSKNRRAWPSIDSEKSAAMTDSNFPLLAKRLENRPLPQLMSTMVCMQLRHVSPREQFPS